MAPFKTLVHSDTNRRCTALPGRIMATPTVSENSHYLAGQGGDGKVFGDTDDEAAQNLKKLGYQQELTRVRSCYPPTSQRLNMDLARLIVSRIIPYIVQYVSLKSVS